MRLTICLALAGLYLPAPAQTGLDHSFGSQGKVVADLGASEMGMDVAVQTDGRIVVLGYRFADGNSDIVLLRYLANGTPDASFGNNGLVITNLTEGYELAEAMTIQPDGRILVTGSTGDPNESTQVMLLRYMPDGTLDPSFGSGGRVLTDHGAFTDGGKSIIVLPDNRIVVLSYSWHEEYAGEVVLTRYLANGDLDPSFGIGGWNILQLSSNVETGSRLLRQSDGKLVIAGSSGLNNMDFMAARTSEDGFVDPGFGSGGHFTLNFAPSSFDGGLDGAIQQDGKILVAGVSDGDHAVIRLNTDGTLDTNFGQNGIVRVPVSDLGDGASAMAVMPDGRIVLGGSAHLGGYEYRVTAVRLLPNGQPDPTFGKNGILLTDFGGQNQASMALAVQPDGRLVAAGYRMLDYTTGIDITVCRYGCGELRPLVQELSILDGQKNSLLSKVDNALKAIAADRPSAKNILGAFINEVEAYRGTGILKASTAEALIAAARCMMAGL